MQGQWLRICYRDGERVRRLRVLPTDLVVHEGEDCLLVTTDAGEPRRMPLSRITWVEEFEAQLRSGR